MSAQEALKTALGIDPQPQKRQLLVMDWKGNGALHTGEDAVEVHGTHSEPNLVVGGNTLASTEVIEAMLRSIVNSAGKPLLLRLILALEAAESRGGDHRGKQSAAARVIQPPEPPTSDDILDLRVDDHPEPVKELQRLYRLTLAK
jgi:uncharacterized Ntn-hydrolase superfamily protein